MICPISEAVRYTPNRRLGYHGGITEQECIAPLAVLASPLVEIEGWQAQVVSPPDWWFEQDTISTPDRSKPRKAATAMSKVPRKPALPLFEAPVAATDWVDALLASEIFAEQMETFASRLRREQIEEYLRVLADRNLVILKSAFAQRLGLSALRVDGLIASLQRILNVEGYAVLSVDSSQTIRINLQLMREQFNLGETNGR